jgi:single-strand DNA-binding protein
MNKVQLVGRICKDLEIKNTSNMTKYCTFTVAVDRRFKDADGKRQADFINCVAWKQTAEFIFKYFNKGSRIGIVGSIQTRNYEDNNGRKVFITEVIVDEAEFVESANKQESQTQAPAPVEPQAQVQEQPQDVGGELPFEI